MPEDLSPQAIKLVRRIQSLPSGRAYLMTLFKGEASWLLSIQDDRGAKIESLVEEK